jgi:DNA primase
MIHRDQIESIRARCDLLALITQDTPLRKVSSANGGEWAGPCPFCGGRDRLRVKPTDGRWWCRQCSPGPRWGDCLDYIMRRHRLSFSGAVAFLGGSAAQPARSSIQPRKPAPGQSHRRAIAPTLRAPANAQAGSAAPSGERLASFHSGWQADAAALLAHAQAELHRSPRVLGWLLRARGIRQETARAWGLGLLPRDSHRLGDWVGGGRRPRLWLPAGLLIPVIGEDGLIWTIKMRLGKRARWRCGCDRYLSRPTCPRCEASRPRYWKAPRTPNPLLGLAHARKREVAVLCEGELDAILLWQEAGDLVDVFSSVTGVGTWRREWESFLVVYDRVLIAYDDDEAGDDYAARHAPCVPCGARLRPPEGKDVKGYWRAGGDLREWVGDVMRNA